MRYSTQIKPISYLKANAAEVLQEIAEQRTPYLITQNGEAKVVLQDVASYEETQETLALLKILALGNQQVAHGKVKSVDEVVKRLRGRTVGRLMGFQALLTEGAGRDLQDIYSYIAEYDNHADRVLERLLQVTDSLATARERGLVPRELAALGIQEYRQIVSKPYRVI
ncbi:MAG TPA: type II toxin-antitoxin system prevent-host-death family antitoxin [Steroidobacteraceae bacterium]|nr:type II toxin-antitoxin system prevent-host-death family antitoxin [Steroidobacteraceae bacterium]